MTVLITGAHGTVGTAITQNCNFDYDILDKQQAPNELSDGTAHPHTSSNQIFADISNKNEITYLFSGYDAIVHLAGSAEVGSSFDQVHRNNIRGVYNCLEAAKHNNINDFIFASSNHVIGQYEKEHAPELYEQDYEFTVDHTSPVRPDSHYGSSKVAGEAWGRQYADNSEIQFYALRLGSIRPPRWDHPYGDAERGVEQGKWKRGSDDYIEQVKRLKCTWQSRRDLAHMVECCLKDEEVTFDIFYGVSNNERSWLDIDHARDRIGYEPQDSSEEYSSPKSF